VLIEQKVADLTAELQQKEEVIREREATIINQQRDIEKNTHQFLQIEYNIDTTGDQFLLDAPRQFEDVVEEKAEKIFKETVYQTGKNESVEEILRRSTPVSAPAPSFSPIHINPIPDYNIPPVNLDIPFAQGAAPVEEKDTRTRNEKVKEDRSRRSAKEKAKESKDERHERTREASTKNKASAYSLRRSEKTLPPIDAQEVYNRAYASEYNWVKYIGEFMKLERADRNRIIVALHPDKVAISQITDPKVLQFAKDEHERFVKFHREQKADEDKDKAIATAKAEAEAKAKAEASIPVIP
jgi:hypothetical protein